MANNTTILLKRSGVSGNVPSQSILGVGELAINYVDGILYYNNGTTVNKIYQANSFPFVNANSSIITALSPSSVLNIAGGNNINISANTLSSTISISSTARSIANVVLTSGNNAPGTTSTYTINYTDTTTSTFTVYNGANGSSSGGGTSLTIGGNTTGTVGTISSGTATLAGGNNITLSQSSNAITIQGPNQSYLVAGNNVTISSTSNSIQFNAPNPIGTSTTFSGTNISATINLGTNGLSLALSGAGAGGGGNSVYLYQPTPLEGSSVYSSFGQNTLYLQPIFPMNNVVMSNFSMLASFNGTSTSVAQSVSQTFSYGLYSIGSGTQSTQYTLLGSSSLGIFGTMSSTGSAAYTISQSTNSYTISSTNSALQTQFTGQKVFQLPFATTLNAGGQYAFAFNNSTAAAGASSVFRASFLVMSNFTNASFGKLGPATNIVSATSINPFPFGAIFSTTTGALPSSFGNSQVSIQSNIMPYLLAGT